GETREVVLRLVRAELIEHQERVEPSKLRRTEDARELDPRAIARLHPANAALNGASRLRFFRKGCLSHRSLLSFRPHTLRRRRSEERSRPWDGSLLADEQSTLLGALLRELEGKHRDALLSFVHIPITREVPEHADDVAARLDERDRLDEDVEGFAL